MSNNISFDSPPDSPRLPWHNPRADTSPLVAVPRPDAKDALWTEPELVAEVEFTPWTRGGRVRHPSFKGLR